MWNEAGQRLTEFCQENALVIANTFFQQHKRRLCTWTSPDSQHWNQIDYILCSQRWRSSIQSAKNMSYKVSVFVLIFCLYNLSINSSMVLRSHTSIMLPSSSPFFLLNFCYLGAPMLSTNAFTIIVSFSWMMPFYYAMSSLSLFKFFVSKLSFSDINVVVLFFFFTFTCMGYLSIPSLLICVHL